MQVWSSCGCLYTKTFPLSPFAFYIILVHSTPVSLQVEHDNVVSKGGENGMADHLAKAYELLENSKVINPIPFLVGHR